MKQFLYLPNNLRRCSCALIIITFFAIAHESLYSQSILWPLAPQNEVHSLFKTYGDWNGFNVNLNSLGFHSGVDMPAPESSLVYAAATGVLTKWRVAEAPSDSGFLCIAINTLDPLAWHYGHIYLELPAESLYIGKPITAQDTIGRIGFFHDTITGDHLHFMRSDTGYNEITGYCNPLDSLSPSPSQAPQLDYRPSPPPHHPYRLYYVNDESEDTTNSYETTCLRDSIDIIARAYTTVQGDPRCGIYAIGYGIEPVTTGGNIPFRKMFEMRDTIEIADSLKYYLTYADSVAQGFHNWYIVTNCRTGAPHPDSSGLSNIKEDCWPTKINTAGTANADSIEDAKFPDGYYVTTIKVWSHSGDSAVALDTVLVDNFNPRVKESNPTPWFAFVPHKQKTIWFKFSEAMDATTLNTTNIKIQSLKSDSFNYPITNITYIDSTYELTLEVDSFRSPPIIDTVQVRIDSSVTDLAGKSIEGGSKNRDIAYTLTFVVSVKQLTDNDLWDLYPDVYHNKIVWAQAPAGTDLGEIMLYDFCNDTTYQISPGGGIHTIPYIYNNDVAWIGWQGSESEYVYYYDGISAQQIAPADRGRYSMEINEGGIVWRSYKTHTVAYDSIWVEYYSSSTDSVYTLDFFLEEDGRYYGNSDIDGEEIVWDRIENNDREVYYYYKGTTENFSSDTSRIDGTPDISYGQITWLKQDGVRDVWYYDGTDKRELDNVVAWAPHLHNGSITWVYGINMPGSWALKFFNGRDTLMLMNNNSGWNNNAYSSINIHNNQVSWLRLVREKDFWEGFCNASYYDGENVLYLTDDTLSKSWRIELHDGFVVYDAWDGNDYEIYLYIGDTLFTPPAIVRDLQGEVITASKKKVHLTWKANTEPDLTGYNIYRSAVPHQYGSVPYGSVVAPDTIFIDTLPLEGMNYYVATAFDTASNEGGFSNQVEMYIDTIPPSSPSDLVTEYDSIHQTVSVIWKKSTNGDLRHYNIYRSEISGSYTTPVDSVLAPDTVFIDSTISLWKTYYYAVSAVDTNQNESGFSNEDSVNTILVTDCAFSTAYNNGHKILVDPADNTIHFAYANEGWLMPNAGIHYCYSEDTGRSFTRSEFVGEAGITGVYPSLALDSQGNPCAAWVSGSNIYYSYWGASWVPPESLPVENISPPSMMVDTTDTVHLVFTHYLWMPPGNGNLCYLKFPKDNFESAVSETLLTDNYCHMPSIVLDDLNNPHILWQGSNCICYLMKDSSGWSGPDTIYATQTSERLYPLIDHFGDKITTVWQDKDTLGNLDIFSRRRNGGVWEDIKKVAETIGESRYPTLASAHYCLWQDNTPGNWDIYISEYIDTSGSWTTPANISNSPDSSACPHGAYGLIDTASAQLYCLWTEGDTIPYTIGYQRIDASPLAKAYADLGQEIQSSYCLSRDGYWIFGEKPYESVDYGNDSVSYQFTGLDPSKKYRLDLSYYFKPNPTKEDEESNKNAADDINDKALLTRPEDKNHTQVDEADKGIGRLIQELLVDGISLDTMFITPHKLVRISIWLPEQVYADGKIIGIIKKVKGKVVVCGEISLYEFNCEEKDLLAQIAGGPQSQNEQSIMRSFLFDGIYPNPTKEVLKIRFNSPDERLVSIKLYDVVGRTLKIIFDGKAKIGMNEYVIRQEGLAAGVYFIRLESDDYRKTEKVIFLR